MTIKNCEYTYFYIHDHLGSTSMVLDADGNISQSVTYVPYGEVFVEERNGAWETPYLFNSKELDEETGFYYYGARYLNPTSAVWMSVDPLFEKYVGMSPYNYCAGNPVKLVDVDGRSTNVAANDDGTYTVVGGNINDNDNGIYLNDKDKTLIGYSATPLSFYNSDEDEWMGRINPNDESGKQFLNEEIQQVGMTLTKYIANAKGGEPYDFKRTNGSNKVIYKDSKDFYRGLPINLKGDNTNLPVYASARDIGNIAAGFIAGVNGLSWGVSRMAFDALESFQHNFDKWYYEGASTQYAERLGFRIGTDILRLRNYYQLRGLPSYGNIERPKVSNKIINQIDFTPCK